MTVERQAFILDAFGIISKEVNKISEYTFNEEKIKIVVDYSNFKNSTIIFNELQDLLDISLDLLGSSGMEGIKKMALINNKFYGYLNDKLTLQNVYYNFVKEKSVKLLSLTGEEISINKYDSINALQNNYPTIYLKLVQFVFLKNTYPLLANLL